MVALEARERSELLPSLLALPPSRRAERAKRSEADEVIALPRPRPLRRPRDRHALHRLAADRRAGLPARPGGPAAAARRADRRRRPARGRGVRSADLEPAQGARRDRRHHRARHPAGVVDERPALLPVARRGDRRGHTGRGAQRPRRRRGLPRHRRAGHQPQREGDRMIATGQPPRRPTSTEGQALHARCHHAWPRTRLLLTLGLGQRARRGQLRPVRRAARAAHARPRRGRPAARPRPRRCRCRAHSRLPTPADLPDPVAVPEPRPRPRPAPTHRRPRRRPHRRPRATCSRVSDAGTGLRHDPRRAGGRRCPRRTCWPRSASSPVATRPTRPSSLSAC